MIFDTLKNAAFYTPIHPGIAKAFAWLHSTDLINIAEGKYLIENENIFAIVQEYETLDAESEQMEAHKKYIDVQYMVQGEELVGLSVWKDQTISKEYDTETDFMLFENEPSFFAKLSEGNFMIFYPTDLHMPCIMTGIPGMVKKIVVKVAV